MIDRLQPKTLWRMAHGVRPEARAMVVVHGYHTTLAWWLGDDVQATMDFDRPCDAKDASDALRTKLIASGWAPLDVSR